jgi:hypothetical protein
MQKNFEHLFVTLNKVDWKLTKEQATLVEQAGGPISSFTGEQSSASQQITQLVVSEPRAVGVGESSSPDQTDHFLAQHEAEAEMASPTSAAAATPTGGPAAAGVPSSAAVAPLSPASWPNPKEAEKLSAGKRELVRNRSNEEVPQPKLSRGSSDS